MTTLDEAAVELAILLRTAVLPVAGTNLVVVTDPRHANPPCTWIQPAEVDHIGLDRGGALVGWYLWLMANDLDTITALRDIDRQRQAIIALGGVFMPEGPALWLPLQLPDSLKPVPALRLTIRTKIT